MTDNLKTWPERIWLQHSESDVPDYKAAMRDGGYSEGVTWCSDCIDEADIEYVRADLVRTEPAGSAEPISDEDMRRYEELEREHFGDPDKRTGIYRIENQQSAGSAEPRTEPVAWRYLDAAGHYRYRGYVPGFDKEYAILKPVPLYLHPSTQSTHQPDVSIKAGGIDMEKERETFEKWATPRCLHLQKRPDGEYASVTTQEAWEAWQARALLAAKGGEA